MSESQIKKEISHEIDKIEIVDPHTHLREDHMSSHVVDVMSYHWILSELNSVGMNYSDVFTNGNYDLEIRLKSVIPYLKNMRNTATARCVYTVFRELYGFSEELTEDNYIKLLGLSLDKCNRKDWADEVFGRANIKKFATSVGNIGSNENQRSSFSLMVDLHYLFWPSGATDLQPWFGEFASNETKYIEALEKVGNRTINTVTDIRKALEEFVTGIYKGRVKFFNTFVPVEFRFCQVDDDISNKALLSYRKSNGKSKKDLEILISYVTWNILDILNELKATLQIAVGAEYFICGGRSISRFESTWVSDMVKICYRFSDIKFDFMNASYVMMHEMAVAAKMIRNFYIQNMWWHTYVPECIGNLYNTLDIVPLTKIGGFYCDAYYCELTYAKLQMVKNVITDVLVRKVEHNVFPIYYALEVADALLNKNPKSLYGI